MGGRRITDIYNVETRADTGGTREAKDSIDDLFSSIEDGANKASNAASDLDKAADSMDGLTNSFLKGAAQAGGMFAFNLASDVIGGMVSDIFSAEDSFRLLEAQTGATADEMAMFRDIADTLFEQGFGDDMNDVVTALSEVERITGLSGDALADATADAILFRDVFEAEITESVRAADVAMNAFGEDSNAIFDMMAFTMQETGDPMNDLLDTVNEYSTTFAEAGFSAEQMFGVLNRGNEAGIFSFDKTADAVREFGIRVREGGDAAVEAFDAIFATGADFTHFDNGIERTIDTADELFQAFSDGEITIAELGDFMSENLGAIEDPIERQRAAAALLGTQYEDLGPAILEAFDLADEGLGDFEGTMDGVQETMQSGFGPAWERLKRTFQGALKDGIEPVVVFLSDNLEPALAAIGNVVTNDVVPIITDAKDVLMDIVTEVGNFASGIIDDLGGVEAILQPIKDVFNDIKDAIDGLPVDDLETIKAAVAGFAAPAVIAILWSIVGAFWGIASSAGAAALAVGAALAPFIVIGAAIAGLVVAYKKNFGGLKDSVDEFFEAISDKDPLKALGALAKAIFAIPKGIAIEVGKLLGIDVEGGLAAWRDNLEMLGIIFSFVKDAIVNFITNGVEFLASALSTGVSFVSNILGTLWNTFISVLTGIGTFIIDVINGWKESFTGQVIINAIRTLAQNIFEGGRELVGKVVQAFTDLKDKLKEHLEDKFGNSIDKVKEFFDDPAGTLESAFGSIKDKISTALSGLGDKIQESLVDPFIEKVAEVISIFTGDDPEALEAKIKALPELISLGLSALPDKIQESLVDPFEEKVGEIVDFITGEGDDSLKQMLINLPDDVVFFLIALPDKIQESLVDPFKEKIDSVAAFFVGEDSLLSDLVAFPQSLGLALMMLGDKVQESLVDPFKEKIDTVVSALFGEEDSLKASLLTLPAVIVEAWSTVKDKIQENLVDPAQEKIDAVLEALFGEEDGLVKGFELLPTLIETAISGLATIVQVPLDAITAAIDGVKGAFDGLFSQIEDLANTEFLGVSVGDIVGAAGGVLDVLNPFADGGFMSRDEVGLVGERGPEFFVPKRDGFIVNMQQAADAVARLGRGNESQGRLAFSGGGVSSGGGITIQTLNLYGVQNPQQLFDELKSVERSRAPVL